MQTPYYSILFRALYAPPPFPRNVSLEVSELGRSEGRSYAVRLGSVPGAAAAPSPDPSKPVPSWAWQRWASIVCAAEMADGRLVVASEEGWLRVFELRVSHLALAQEEWLAMHGLGDQGAEHGARQRRRRRRRRHLLGDEPAKHAEEAAAATAARGDGGGGGGGGGGAAAAEEEEEEDWQEGTVKAAHEGESTCGSTAGTSWTMSTSRASPLTWRATRRRTPRRSCPCMLSRPCAWACAWRWT